MKCKQKVFNFQGICLAALCKISKKQKILLSKKLVKLHDQSMQKAKIYKAINLRTPKVDIKLTIYFVEMNLTDFIDDIFVVKRNETKTSVTICDLVIGQHGILNMTELFEISPDILQTCRC